MRNSRSVLLSFLFAIQLFFGQNLCAQVLPIIDNGFLSTQAWGAAIHPSGKFIVRADRTTIHAYDRFNNMLFQSFQTQCIASTLFFTANGNYLIVATTGEIGELCNRTIVYNFKTGKEILNLQGFPIKSLTSDNLVYVVCQSDKNDSTDVYNELLVIDVEKLNKLKENQRISSGFTKSDLGKVERKRYDFISTSFNQLIVDSLLIQSTGQDLVMYNLNTGADFDTIGSVKIFGYNYFPNEKKIFFTPIDRSDYYRSYNFKTHTKRTTNLNAYSKDHVLFLNDSMVYSINVYQELRSYSGVPYNCSVDKYNLNGFEYYPKQFILLDTLIYDLFTSEQTYYSEVLSQHKLVLHNRTHLIDLNTFTSKPYRTSIDTTLIHPGTLSFKPASDSFLCFNNYNWDIAGNVRITERNYLTNLSSTSVYLDTLEDFASSSSWIVEAMLRNHGKLDFERVNFPLSSKGQKESDDMRIGVLSQNYWDCSTSRKYIHLKKYKGDFYLSTMGDKYMISSQLHYMKRDDWDAKSMFSEIYTEKFLNSLVQLNSYLPMHVLPFRLQEAHENPDFFKKEKLEMKISVDDPKKAKGDFLFNPISDKQLVYFLSKERAKEKYILNLFKTYIDGKGTYTVNTLNCSAVPDLTYSGIIPENDVYFYDLTFPFSSKRNVSINYAHGEIKFLDLSGDWITKSSFYKNSEFIHVTREGYYYASKNKLNKISIQYGDKVYPLEQFDLKYNRPDLVLKELGSKDTTLMQLYHKAYLKRLKKLGFTEDMLKEDFHLPQIKILNFENLPSITSNSEVELNLNLSDSKYNFERLNVLVNNVPVFGTLGIDLRQEKTSDLNKSIKVQLAEGKNLIQLSVLNQAGAESYKENVVIVKNSRDTIKPNLYLITIGDSKYKDSRYNLTYASKDANDIKQLLLTNATGVYAEVFSRTLVDEQITIENILSLKELLAKAKLNDVVLLTIAGHGVLDKDLNYYLATYNMDFNKPEIGGMPYEKLEDLLDGIAPLKKVILIDACHSGEIDKDEVEQLVVNNSDSKSDIKFRNAGAGIKSNTNGLQSTSNLMNELFSDLRKGTGASVFASAGGAELAMESETWKNGLFTYCFLEGLKNMSADINGDGKIMFSELQSYIRERVILLSNGIQQPNARMENSIMDFRIW